ncbi:MAG TPA: response regulator transcription factor [Gemmatimonadaceae bacterium]|jgi:DNA-binding NarL/FixJ family response regulator|nr:response regulator transcription factor [Gemmatimonadaceae bacterium]
MQFLIVSPVRLLRDGLAMLLGQRPQVTAVRTAASAEDALILLRDFRPTLVLLDVGSPARPHVLRQIATTSPSAQVLGFAAGDNDEDVLAYAEAGIAGFVSRDASIDDLFDALERAARGELLCTARTAGTMFRRLAALAGSREVVADDAQLTSRERQILKFVDEGLSNKEIAHRLQIGVSTVKNHVHRILEKLHVSRRGEAAARLRRTVAGVSAQIV